MSFENTVSCVSHGTAGTVKDIPHNLGATPDIVILTPQLQASTSRISSRAYLGSSTFANNSIVCIAATFGSVPLQLTAWKLHSIIT